MLHNTNWHLHQVSHALFRMWRKEDFYIIFPLFALSLLLQRDLQKWAKLCSKYWKTSKLYLNSILLLLVPKLLTLIKTFDFFFLFFGGIFVVLSGLVLILFPYYLYSNRNCISYSIYTLWKASVTLDLKNISFLCLLPNKLLCFDKQCFCPESSVINKILLTIADYMKLTKPFQFPTDIVNFIV